MNSFEKDFKDFLSDQSSLPSLESSELILTKVSKDLKVNPWLLTTKVALLYSFTSFIFLYFCPQFGVSWGAPSATLTSIYMSYGANACAALCAITLVGGNFLLLALALKNSESYWLKKQMPWIPISLSVLTLVLLISNGATPHHHHTEFALWILFAIISGCLLFEGARKSKIFSQRLLMN